ncbi:MAG: glycosyltransferase family 2 protein [Acetobacteraceae bacterium]
MSPSRRTAVVIPTLNEAATIRAVVGEIPRGIAAEIIVADGGSRDGTAAAARSAGARAILVDGPGYGRACRTGAEAATAGADIIAFLDGDGADRADLLGCLVGPIAAGTHDFVLASRTLGDREPGAMLWHQVLAGRLVGAVIRARTGVRYTDMCAFRAVRREALAALEMREDGYGWNVEMQVLAALAGLRIVEIPMPYRSRAGGRSKVAGSWTGTLKAGARILIVVARVMLRRRRP